MGPLRGGVIAALLPAPAMAGVCEAFRPGWSGSPVGPWAEAAALFGSPASLVLLLATAIVMRLRSQWGAAAVCVAWSLLVSAFTFFDPTGGQRAAAMAEGCVGSPVVFIAAVGLICVAMVLYTGRGARAE